MTITAEIIADAKATLSAEGFSPEEIEAALPAIGTAAAWYAGHLEGSNAAVMENVRSGYCGKGGIFEAMFNCASMPAKLSRELGEAVA